MNSKEEVEQAILKSFVGGTTSLLEGYFDMKTSEEYFFQWSTNDNGQYLVKFKPRAISFGVINKWLQNPSIKDIWLTRQSSFSANLMGAKAPIMELNIFMESMDEQQ